MTDREDRSAAAASRRRLPDLVSLDSYAAVAVLVVVTYVLTVTISDERPAFVLAAQMLTVWLVMHVSRAARGTRIVATIALVFAAGAALVHTVGDKSEEIRGILFLTSALLYVVAPVAILRELLRRPEVDREVVIGALDAYVLIGMAFAFVTLTVSALDPDPYFGDAGNGSAPTHLFFSFTTLTTTGYGNLVPASSVGQSLAVAEMLIGQLFLISAVAKVLTAWRPKRWNAPEGPPDIV